MSSTLKTYKIDDYTIVYDSKTELIKEVLRHGQSWRKVHGDNLIHGLFWKVLELEAKQNDT